MSNEGYSKEQQDGYFYHGACPECGSAEDLEPNDRHDRGIRTRSRLVYCDGCDAEVYEVHFREVGCRFLSREDEDEEPDEDDDDVDPDEGEDEEEDKIASFIKPILTVEILEFAIKRMQRSQRNAPIPALLALRILQESIRAAAELAGELAPKNFDPEDVDCDRQGKVTMNEDELVNRAAAAYLAWCKRCGYEGQLPCKERSEVVGNTVHLRNVNGDLARYRVDAKSTLHWLWDAGTTPAAGHRMLRTPGFLGETVEEGEGEMLVTVDHRDPVTEAEREAEVSAIVGKPPTSVDEFRGGLDLLYLFATGEEAEAAARKVQDANLPSVQGIIANGEPV